MKKISLILFTLTSILILFTACQKDEHKLGDLKAPTDLNVTIEIIGADSENPYGDGSGFVHLRATANGYTTFIIDFDDGLDKVIKFDGDTLYRLTKTGINTYNVTVSAIGTGGLQTTKIQAVEVFSSFEDPDALEFLTGGSSKSWYWAADQPAHAGLGPVSEDNGNFEYTFPNWWQIVAWDPDKACMYDAEFVFTKTDNGLTFEQKSGPAFIPGAYADVIGIPGDLCYGEDVVPNLYGVKNVSFAPSSTLAGQSPDYRGTAFTLSDNGTMCWWVGTSTYDILEISDTQMKVRIEQDATFAWYHTFVSEKPVQ
jgi:hypothetical protein